LSRDGDGHIWTGSEDELACWQGNELQSRWPGRGNTTREHTFPRTLLADSQGAVWLGIEDEGVYRFDRTRRKFEHIDIGYKGCDIHAFAEDRSGRIWIGSELGVCTYQNGTVRWEDGINKIIRNAPVTTFLWINDGKLLMTTLGRGIYCLAVDHTDAPVLSRGTADGTLPTDKINHAISDGKGGVWLGSYEGLIHVADAAHLEGITVYDRKHGLADNHVRALQMDRDRIWMSTYSGISCFDPKTERFYNYNHFDNRYLSGFASGAAATDKEGRIYFASAQGVCYFNPRNFDSRRLVSDVQIVSCEVYNPMGSDTEILSLTPHDDGRVHANYEQNTLRLVFTVRNAAQTGDEEYAYMMKGMSDRWYYIDGDQDVVFRGLAPGNYTFILRARLKGQDWEDASETQLDISIAPPLWRTWWAYLLYAMVIGAVVWYMFHSYQRRLKLRNSLELEKQEHRQKQELNEERLRFFTNVTHELRTPLTLILGPLEDLMDDRQLPQASKQKVMMIHKSAERLRSLINSILEFRKTETQNRRLTVAKGDIGQFVREICLNFKELTRNQKVQFCCEVDEDLPKVFFDSEIINTVMNNYLSNAIKYTEEGTIKVEVSRKDEARIAISVADTGYGIAAEALPHVFERYYQADGNHQASGTGIGLALVKSLADLHEAEVSADSREGQGSRFTFSLYIDNTYPNALHKEDVEREEGRGKKEESAAAKEASEETTPLLLVVEDNDDIRQYIADSFGEEYRILQAANGEEGVITAQEQMPDIIVSDIMMPRMNGIELTKTLKEDIRTCHIPIILLTAKDSDEDKEEGYDSGADSYLTKPFTAKLLGSRIRNILASRRRLAEQIVISSTPAYAAPSSGDQTPQLSRLDQAFIDKLNRLIEDNIMQEDIDLAFVTDKMAMSHSTFYRKVKALTGLTAKEYIRKRRLHHCYQLLQSGDYNVSQAAMMTGFNQMAHFRETFKKEFGILPSEVRRK
jgi:signal transduction histidine kinase/DNA-binding response OmpR family regulator